MKKFGLLVLGSLGACDSMSSTKVSTHDMGIHVNVTVSDDGSARAVTQFTTDNPALLEVTYIRLENGDFAYARSGSKVMPLRESWMPVINIYQYEQSFEVAPGDNLSFVLERANEEHASDTYVVIPRSIEVVVPEEFEVDEGLMMTWEGAEDADDFLVDVDGCFENVEVSMDPLEKSLFLGLDDLQWRTSVDPNEPCEFEIVFKAIRHGDTDPAFGRRSRVVAVQERRVSSVAMPGVI